MALFNFFRSVPSRALAKGLKISKPIVDIDPGKHEVESKGTRTVSNEYEMSKRSEAEHCIHRLLLMSYFPSGFW